MTQLLRTPSRSSLSRALCTLALTGITACSDLFGPKERVVVMDIAPQRVPCVGVGPMQCLSVRERPDTAWTLLYDGIEGFSFEPGYQYTIRVAVRTVHNPPADGSSLAYRLLALIQKVPGQQASERDCRRRLGNNLS